LKIAVSCAKGGVGKTTVCANLGAYLARAGRKVLLMDIDPQGNLQGTFHVDTENTLAELLTEGRQDCIIEAVRPNLDLILSGRKKLFPAQLALERDPYEGLSAFDTRLDFIKKLGYDFILLDFSPTDTFINRAALMWIDSLLMPLSPSLDAILGAERYLDISNETNKRRFREGKKDIELFGILVNMYENRVVLSRQIDEAARKKWGEKVFKTVIRRNIAFAEARAMNKTVHEYNPKSHGAADFEKLTEEILNGKRL